MGVSGVGQDLDVPTTAPQSHSQERLENTFQLHHEYPRATEVAGVANSGLGYTISVEPNEVELRLDATVATMDTTLALERASGNPTK
jgi:hypothetical protein